MVMIPAFSKLVHFTDMPDRNELEKLAIGLADNVEKFRKASMNYLEWKDSGTVDDPCSRMMCGDRYNEIALENFLEICEKSKQRFVYIDRFKIVFFENINPFNDQPFSSMFVKITGLNKNKTVINKNQISFVDIMTYHRGIFGLYDVTNKKLLENRFIRVTTSNMELVDMKQKDNHVPDIEQILQSETGY